MLIGVTEARAKATQVQVEGRRPGFAAAVPGRAGRAVERAVAPDGRGREVPRAQVGPELPRPAGAARRHREPHHRGAQSLHPGGAGLQRHDPQVPDQPHGHDLRLQGEAELHGRERGRDREAADGGLQRAAGHSGARARRPPLRPTEALLASRPPRGATRGDPHGRRVVPARIPSAAARPVARGVAVARWPQSSRRHSRSRASSPFRSSPRGSPTSPARSTADQSSALEAKLAAFEQSKGSQVAVLIVPTTQPEDIEQYSIRVVDQWKLGREQGR